jgi:hypothetical protein
MLHVKNIIKFRKAVNDKTDKSLWIKYIVNVIKYDEELFNKHYKVNSIIRKERLKRKKAKKVLSLTVRCKVKMFDVHR